MVNMEKEKEAKWPSHAFTQPLADKRVQSSGPVEQLMAAAANQWIGSVQGTSKGTTKEAPQSTCSRQFVRTEMVSPRRLANGRSSATHKVTRLIPTKGPGILLIASEQQNPRVAHHNFGDLVSSLNGQICISAITQRPLQSAAHSTAS
jgi:hypothetical protein